MLVVISDLHLQDVSLQGKNIRSDQNVGHKAFVNFFQWVAEEYADKVKDEYKNEKDRGEIKIVLNGDIIDFLRTERWFLQDKDEDGNPQPGIRPYGDYSSRDKIDNEHDWSNPTAFPLLTDEEEKDTEKREYNKQLEKILLEIFDVVTGKEHFNGGDYTKSSNIETIKGLAAFRVFKRLGSEKHTDEPTYPAEDDLKDLGIPPETLGRLENTKIEYIYIPGNHDRLVNVSSRLNEAIRRFFFIKNHNGHSNYDAERFPWEIRLPSYRVLVEHGHIYDWKNCEFNVDFLRKDAKKLADSSFSWKHKNKDLDGYEDNKLYYNTPIGDLLTIDLPSYLPYIFKEDFLKKEKSDTHLEKVYGRLLEIDDVRPFTAVVPWLYNLAREDEDKELWEEKIVPTVKKTLGHCFARDDSSHGEFYTRWMREHDRPFWPDKSELFGDLAPQGEKLLKIFPGWFVNKLAKPIKFVRRYWPFGDKDKFAKAIIEHEENFMEPNGEAYLVAGHIHTPNTLFLRHDKTYHCTGTWRVNHFSCLVDDKRPNTGKFKKMKSQNFIYFFEPNEVEEWQSHKRYIWNGLLDKW